MSPYDKPTPQHASTNPPMNVVVVPSVPVRNPIMGTFCGLDLKTGALIVAYFQIVICVVGIIFFAVMMSTHQEDSYDVMLMVKIIYGVSIGFLAVIVLASLLLLAGVYKDVVGLVTAFIVIYGIFVCINIIGCIRTLISGGVSLLMVMQLLATALIGIVSLVTTQSFRTQMINRKQALPIPGEVPLSSPPPYVN